MALFECGYNGIDTKLAYQSYPANLVLRDAKLVAVLKGWKKATGTNYQFISGLSTKSLIDPNYFATAATTVSSRNYLQVLKTFRALIIATTSTASANITSANDFRLYCVDGTGYDPYNDYAPLFFVREGSEAYGPQDTIERSSFNGTISVVSNLYSGYYLVGKQYNKVDVATVREVYIFDTGLDLLPIEEAGSGEIGGPT